MIALRRALVMLVNSGGLLAGLVLVGLFALSLAEITNRAVFGQSFPFAVEYSGYLVALSFFLGSGWALRQSGHIRITLIADRLPGRLQHRLDIVATSLALAIALFAAVALMDWALSSYQRGDVSFFPSETPLWIPQAAFSAGPGILAAALLERLIGLITDCNDTEDRA